MIIYKNNYGQSVNLTDWPYMMSESDLFDYEWLYETKSSSNTKVSRFYRDITTKTVKLSIASNTEALHNEAVVNLLNVTERDVIGLNAGRLYVGNMYLPCYFVKSKISDYYPGSTFLVDEFTIISEKGSWFTEKTTTYNNSGISEVLSDDNNLDYPYDFPFDYASGMVGRTLDNDGFSGADFEITIYGGCSNPEINIAGHSYAVTCELATGEYLKINSATKKIYKVKISGEVVNQFNYRNRDSYIFEKIKSGKNSVTWSGLFGFEITIYEERSRPIWT